MRNVCRLSQWIMFEPRHAADTIVWFLEKPKQMLSIKHPEIYSIPIENIIFLYIMCCVCIYAEWDPTADKNKVTTKPEKVKNWRSQKVFPWVRNKNPA